MIHPIHPSGCTPLPLKIFFKGTKMQSPRILQTVNMLPDKDSNHKPRKKCKKGQELVPR